MRTETIEIFTYDELNNDAKERARDWWRSLEADDVDLSLTIDDATAAARILGIDISTRTVKTCGGETRQIRSDRHSRAHVSLWGHGRISPIWVGNGAFHHVVGIDN